MSSSEEVERGQRSLMEFRIQDFQRSCYKSRKVPINVKSESRISVYRFPHNSGPSLESRFSHRRGLREFRFVGRHRGGVHDVGGLGGNGASGRSGSHFSGKNVYIKGGGLDLTAGFDLKEQAVVARFRETIRKSDLRWHGPMMHSHHVVRAS